MKRGVPKKMKMTVFTTTTTNLSLVALEPHARENAARVQLRIVRRVVRIMVVDCGFCFVDVASLCYCCFQVCYDHHESAVSIFAHHSEFVSDGFGITSWGFVIPEVPVRWQTTSLHTRVPLPPPPRLSSCASTTLLTPRLCSRERERVCFPKKKNDVTVWNRGSFTQPGVHIT